MVGAPARSAMRSEVKTAILASAESWNSGANGMSERRSRILRFQSGQAVDQVGVAT